MMGITFDIRSNIESLDEYLDDIKTKAVINAATSAINKTLLTARKESVAMMAKHYKTGSSKSNALTKNELRDGMRIKKAKGSLLSQLEGTLTFSGKTFPILKFVKGSKNILKQKGVKIKRRRVLKAEIIRGKRVVLKKAFIQKANSTQVFKGRSGSGFKRQAVAGSGQVMMRNIQKAKMLDIVAKRFNEVFAHELQFKLDRLADKQKAKRMKKI